MEIGSALIFYIISAIGFILGYDMLSASICGVVTLVMAFYSYRRSELIKFLEECGEIDPNL